MTVSVLHFYYKLFKLSEVVLDTITWGHLWTQLRWAEVELGWSDGWQSCSVGGGGVGSSSNTVHRHFTLHTHVIPGKSSLKKLNHTQQTQIAYAGMTHFWRSKTSLQYGWQYTSRLCSVHPSFHKREFWQCDTRVLSARDSETIMSYHVDYWWEIFKLVIQ